MSSSRGSSRDPLLVARGEGWRSGGRPGERGPAPATHRQCLSGASSHGRRHGDPFPLPQPPAEFLQPLTTSMRTRVLSAVSCLNQLAASTSNSIRAQGHDCSPPVFAREVTAVQREMLRSIIRRVEAYGAAPEFFDDEESLKEILAACGQYDMEPKHIAPFDPKLLNVLKKGDRLQGCTANVAAGREVLLDGFPAPHREVGAGA